MSANVHGQHGAIKIIVAVVTSLAVLLIIRETWHQLDNRRFHALDPRSGGARVLVTGVAGFVGFHVAKELAKHPDNVVVGIDNFNEYYDVQLKIDRAYELHRHGVAVHRADLCDEAWLSGLFRAEAFTHVVHLGAQAGVRYSLDHPLVYVHSNIEGYRALLNVLAQHTDVHLVYASSSSVYGKNSSVPFRLSANTDNPGNMYAATKRANELMSYEHCARTGARPVGLRFFTVYGPWGRPDMAVYRFAESILDGEKVPMFHISDDAPLGRDFTYIDDIIAGIMSSMSYRPSHCGAVFNLGFGHPVSVPKLVTVLEAELETEAQIDKLPLPPTEILQTWADTEVSRRELDFRPTTDLVQGVREFVAWFREYRERRESQRQGTGPSVQAKAWFDGLPLVHISSNNVQPVQAKPA